jgi:hypothetical protein
LSRVLDDVDCPDLLLVASPTHGTLSLLEEPLEDALFMEKVQMRLVFLRVNVIQFLTIQGLQLFVLIEDTEANSTVFKG